MSRSSLPIDVEPSYAERVGREALATIGYVPILNLAREAGWVDSVFVKTEHTPFDQLVESYRAIESDFVSRVMSDEFLVLETRRRIAERILITAIDKAIDEELPFDVCPPLWGNVVELGFTDLERACRMSWYYAKLGCLLHRQSEEGIRVLEPLLAELTRALSKPALPKTAKRFYKKEFRRLQGLLDALRSQ